MERRERTIDEGLTRRHLHCARIITARHHRSQIIIGGESSKLRGHAAEIPMNFEVALGSATMTGATGREQKVPPLRALPFKETRITLLGNDATPLWLLSVKDQLVPSPNPLLSTGGSPRLVQRIYREAPRRCPSIIVHEPTWAAALRRIHNKNNNKTPSGTVRTGTFEDL
ncbi:unnamed protein product [Lampetra fluviatilis]